MKQQEIRDIGDPNSSPAHAFCGYCWTRYHASTLEEVNNWLARHQGREGRPFCGMMQRWGQE